MPGLLTLFLQLWFVWKGIDASVQEKYDACDCSKYSASNKKSNFTGVRDEVTERRSYEISCCAKRYIGNQRGDFNVTWTYQGIRNDVTSFKPQENCHGQVLFSKVTQFTDSGNYTCIISVEDGSTFSKLIIFKVTNNQFVTEIPRACNSYNASYVQELGHSFTLNCTFCMKKVSNDFSIRWRKVLENGSKILFTALPDVEIKDNLYRQENYQLLTSMSEGDDRYISRVILKNISKVHLGNYICAGVTPSLNIQQKIAIINDVTPGIKEKRHWVRILVCAVAGFICLIVSIFAAFRCRYNFALNWRALKGHCRGLQKDVEDYEHDVFIIHGPSASIWVRDVLLDKLELKWRYNCFLPDRDILGGEDKIGIICHKLCKSRRAIIVASECLLTSYWCVNEIFRAIHTSLRNSSRVFAITFEDISKGKGITQTAEELIDVLRLLRRIQCPKNLTPNSVSWHFIQKICHGEDKSIVEEKRFGSSNHREATRKMDSPNPLPPWKSCISKSFSSPNILKNYIDSSPPPLCIPKAPSIVSLPSLTFGGTFPFRNQGNSHMDLNELCVSPSGDKRSLLSDIDRTKCIQFVIGGAVPSRHEIYSTGPNYGSDEGNDEASPLQATSIVTTNGKHANKSMAKFFRLFKENPKKIFWQRLRLHLPTLK